MSWPGKRARGVVAATAAALVAGLSAGAALDNDSRLTAQASALPGACAAASAATVARVDTIVANHIYQGELRSGTVSADVAHVTGSRELTSALAGSNAAAIYAAVHKIVYTPRWHIVRLRVLKNARVVADIGGPHIIAPVSGSLRFKGRKLASFVMSVQDDVGYVKLVSRFIGIPVDIYQGGSFLMGTLQPAPPPPANDGEPVTVQGSSYRASLIKAAALASGPLEIALFIHAHSGALAKRGCAAVRASGWGRVARHIASRFKPLKAHYNYLVDTLRGMTGGLAFVRAGSKRLAGGAGPAKLPRSGTVSYGGRSWSVYSWEPVPPARVYLLTPAN